MSVMAPQQVLLSAVNEDGSPALPSSIQIPGGPLVPVWDDAQKCQVGDAVFWEYRHWATGRLVVFQLVAYTAERAVLVVWAPALERIGRNPIYQALAPVTAAMGLLLGAWDIEQDEDGAFVVPALESDDGAQAVEVKAAWPADWRKRLPGDDPGNPFADPPVLPAPPSGARCLGLVIA